MIRDSKKPAQDSETLFETEVAVRPGDSIVPLVYQVFDSYSISLRCSQDDSLAVQATLNIPVRGETMLTFENPSKVDMDAERSIDVNDTA